ncbi:MAG TPA: sigma-70 family RNA polymerase sigma factor [Kofleriaceae bacterium]|nr:sigma-70 family RNA polymerase sigma factor [Kofleriaceae bacterium]
MGQTIAMTDGELLEASRRGERAAFGALVERYQHVVCAITYSRTRDQALSEDVAQETFIAAWKQLDQLREPGSLRSWLFGIARNLARKARRRTDRETPIEEPIAVASDNPFDAVSGAQAERVVGEALSRVPETYRDVLVLYYREQRSVREVAAALGISEAATLQRLARGRQCLANGLTSLVERSLRGQRKPRRDLVAAVVLALPPIIRPSRAIAKTSVSHGGSMLKLAIAAVAITAAGTTAYLVHDSRGGASAASPAALAAAATPAVAAPVPAPGPAHQAALAPSLPPSASSATTSATTSATAAPAALGPKAPAAGPGPGGPGDPGCEKCKDGKPTAASDADVDEIVPAATIARLGLERGPSRGPAAAPVSIVMFTDLKCKYCGGALGLLDQLEDEYAGKVRVVVKQMPLSPLTAALSEALYAAEAQGKFWELHDLLRAHQEELTADSALALAPQAGLDVGKLRAALEQGTYRAKLEADRAAAAELKVMGTPAFFINGQRVFGLQSPATFRAAIDRALAGRR